MLPVDEPVPESTIAPMEAWRTRVKRVARRLDIPVETGGYHGAVRVRVEDLELLAERLGR